MSIDERIAVIGRHPYRARFHLCGHEHAIVQPHALRAVHRIERALEGAA